MIGATSKISAEVERSASEDYFDPNSDTSVTRSDLVLPVSSLLLPGVGQWIGGDYAHGAVYSGLALGGIRYSQLAKAKSNFDDKELLSPTLNDTAARKHLIGLQTYQSMGGFSLYHSFRSAVSLRKRDDQYQFLTHQERPLDLALAPLDFKYLKRSSTWVPLTIGVLINSWILQHPAAGWQRGGLTRDDPVFAAGFSWNAGTHEEAVFRGWMMPVLREYWLNDTWSNATQSVAFAGAHLNSTSVPIAQLALGWHLGSVTQSNHWTLGESIFIHAWWDVLAFMTAYQLHKQEGSAGQPASISLQPLNYRF